jgi:hypothetical protein
MVKLNLTDFAVCDRVSFALLPALPVVVVPTPKVVALAILTDAEARRQAQMLVDRAFMPGRNMMRGFMILGVMFVVVSNHPRVFQSASDPFELHASFGWKK